MSYILEAIKKADLKRKIGNVPDIHSDHNAHLSEPNHRTLWPYILAIVLFFNAGLIAWWLQPWGNTTTEKGTSPPLPSHIEESANIPLPGSNNALPPVMAGIPISDGPLDQGEPILPQASPANIIPTPPIEADTTSKFAPIPDPKLPAEETIHTTTPATLSERLGAVTHSLAQETATDKDPQNITNKPLPTPAVLPPVTDPKMPPQGVAQKTPPATLSERLGAVTHSLAHKTVAEKAPQNNIKPVPTDAGLPASNDKAELSSLPAQTKLMPLRYQPVLLTPNGDKDLEGTILASQVTNQTQLDDNETNETTENELDDSAEPETIAEPGRPVFDIKKVPLLYQLPESVQKDIPEIKISFHSYRYRPSSRLVRINGRIMREGQKITTDLILEKIIPSGVVLLFENKRFRVGL